MQTTIHIPESLQARFLASCAEADINSEQAIKALMEEFLTDLEEVKIAKARADSPQGFISLEQLIHEHDLDV